MRVGIALKPMTAASAGERVRVRVRVRASCLTHCCSNGRGFLWWVELYIVI
jgi:hypothetical protein